MFDKNSFELFLLVQLFEKDERDQSILMVFVINMLK